jgi:hypothetical protein
LGVAVAAAALLASTAAAVTAAAFAAAIAAAAADAFVAAAATADGCDVKGNEPPPPLPPPILSGSTFSFMAFMGCVAAPFMTRTNSGRICEQAMCGAMMAFINSAGGLLGRGALEA